MSISLDLSNATPEQIAEIINYLKGQPSQIAEVKKTYVAMVLDESGSMEMCRDATIEGFNSTLRTFKESPKDAGEFYITLVKVNGTAKVSFQHVPVSKVQYLTRETYCPGGGTPLYDGIGIAIATVASHAVKRLGVNNAQLVSVFTDGQENSSLAWSGPTLSKKIVELQNDGTWTFTVTGANISLTDLSQVLSIPRANMQQYTSTPAGTHEAWNSHNHSAQQYSLARSAGTQNSSNFYNGSQTLFDQTQQQVDTQINEVPPFVKTSEQIELERTLQEAQRLQAQITTPNLTNPPT